MEEFTFKRNLSDIKLNGRNITLDHKVTEEAFKDFAARLKRGGIRGEFQSPLLDDKRTIDRCMVIHVNKSACHIEKFIFDRAGIEIKGVLSGPKSADFFGKPVDLKMRALVRPREDDAALTEVVKIITFDLCALE